MMWPFRAGSATLKMRATSDLGSVLMRLSIITEQQLSDAIKRQVANHPHARLGEVLVRLGYVTQEQVQRALELQHKMRTHKASEVMADILNERTDKLETLLVSALK